MTRTEPLLLLTVNLYTARDAFGHGDRSQGLASTGASFVLRTPRCDVICTNGYGYRESTVVTDSNGGNVSTRPMERDLAAEGSRACAGRTTDSLERPCQSPRRTWGACGR